MLKVAIIAGEPSGDMLAAHLMRGLKAISSQKIEFIGIGGANMALEGLVSSYDMDILSIGGFGLDVIKAIPHIFILRLKIIKQIIEFKPDVFIGVDAPDFNFYVERQLRKKGIKTVHYISPTIWAWRYSRIFKIKKSTDLMLCVFPMEEPLYRQENIKAKFIGHHLADAIDMDINTLAYKKKLGLMDKCVFSVLVGSRKSEVMSLGKVFIEACEIINRQIPNAVFIFPMVNQSISNLFLHILEQMNISFKYEVLINCSNDCIKASDLVLAKSGTVTLEVALCKKPLIISYKISKFSEWILKKLLTIQLVGQPNILLNEEVAKELLQDEATAKNLAKYFVELYNNKQQQEYMIKRFYELHHILRKNASIEGAKAVLELIQCYN